MEIILKKTKISNSVLKQIQRPSAFNISAYDILGWCIFEKRKWIILYNPLIFDVKKFPFFAEAEKHNNFEIKVTYDHRYVTDYYKNDNAELQEKLLESLIWMKQQATLRGQFFI